MDYGLSNKVAVVTGATGGIGKAICILLAKNGVNLVLSGRNTEKLDALSKEIETYGVKSISVITDVTNEESMNNLLQRAIDEFDQVDIMINNAGVSLTKPLLLCDESDYNKIFDTNVKSVYLGCKAALEHMLEQGYGKIVNMSSQAGKEGFAGMTLYSSSKFAITGLTQALAKEVGEYDINVNCVCPGIILTQMWDEISNDASKLLGVAPQDVINDMVNQIPLKRPQTEEDIAHVVAFLCSDLAKNITAQGINVTGGLINS